MTIRAATHPSTAQIPAPPAGAVEATQALKSARMAWVRGQPDAVLEQLQRAHAALAKVPDAANLRQMLSVVLSLNGPLTPGEGAQVIGTALGSLEFQDIAARLRAGVLTFTAGLQRLIDQAEDRLTIGLAVAGHAPGNVLAGTSYAMAVSFLAHAEGLARVEGEEALAEKLAALRIRTEQADPDSGSAQDFLGEVVVGLKRLRRSVENEAPAKSAFDPDA